MKVLQTLKLRAFTFLNLRALYKTSPTIESFSDKEVTVGIPLNKRNSYRGTSLSFGPILMGAECAAGFLFGKAVLNSKQDINWAIVQGSYSLKKRFKSNATFKAFLEKNAEEYVNEILESRGSVEVPVEVIGYDQSNECADFKFTVKLQAPKRTQCQNPAQDRKT